MEYKERIKSVKEPHLFIYLKTSMDNILDRIRERGREFEKDLDMDFLITISQMYDQFFSEIEGGCVKSEVLIIDTDNYDANQVFDIVMKHVKDKDRDCSD